jgi:hypothetical protein
MIQQFLLLADRLFVVAKLTMQIPDLSFQALDTRLIPGALLPEGIEFRLRLLQRSLNGLEFLGQSAPFLSHLLLLGPAILERLLKI